MKNQLRIEHFIQEPKPDEETDKYQDLVTVGFPPEPLRYDFNKELFEKDLKEWREKYEEPEYDWVSFEGQEPIHRKQVYMSSHKKNAGVWGGKYDNRIIHGFSYWCNKDTHDAKVKKYQDNQVVFEGWESNGKSALKNEIFVEFREKEIKINGPCSVIYEGPCDIELFKHLGRVNGF